MTDSFEMIFYCLRLQQNWLSRLSTVVGFGATILIFYLATAQKTADFGSIFLSDHTRGKKSDEANILVHYGPICQALSNNYEVFLSESDWST